MNRVRWLSANWPVSMRVLGSRMKDYQFTPDSFDGFVIERIRDNTIEARFIEKIIYSEITIDPFGREETFERVTYRSVNFSLFSEFPHIELRNCQRSTKEFVSKLLELCNFSLSVSSISVNLFDWVEELQQYIEQSLYIDSLQLSGLVLEDGVSAKVLLKGNKDVREAVNRLATNKNFNLDKLQVKVRIAQKIVPIHLNSSGAAMVPSDFFEEFLPLIRSSLARMHEAAVIRDSH